MASCDTVINFITHKLHVEKRIHKGEAGIVDFLLFTAIKGRITSGKHHFFSLKHLLDLSKPPITMKMDNAL